jgi:hypothetical protein
MVYHNRRAVELERMAQGYRAEVMEYHRREDQSGMPTAGETPAIIFTMVKKADRLRDAARTVESASRIPFAGRGLAEMLYLYQVLK